MAVIQDFVLAVYEDGSLTVSMQPPTPIGGWALQFSQGKRFGGAPLVLKSASSGFYGVSGVTVVNSGQGVLSVSLWAADMSGMDPGAYAYKVSRTDSGSVTALSEGYRICRP